MRPTQLLKEQKDYSQNCNLVIPEYLLQLIEKLNGLGLKLDF
ncbi:15524_t:CDS:2 [Funneliformis geosporum]|uniref:15524_t:CDS:1 n=1 Tax=Funneliformis geosporum TaxID=1117311 RepID=A0A9W4SMR8_9GLOM|nr:15524_t:CDS:2 [Funneliformis geosporum]